MERSGVLSAWWMPPEEEEFWEASRASAAAKVTFLAGVFVILNSLSHSVVRIFFDRGRFTIADHVWIPHCIVELLCAVFSFVYALWLFTGWAEGDRSFLQDRVFAATPHQELLINVHSAYSIYTIGVSLLNYRAFKRDRVWLNVTRASVTLGMNYLSLLFPCVLTLRLRIYWSLLELATCLTIFTRLTQFFDVKPKSIVLMSMASMLLCLARFWVAMFLLLWSYHWLSTENMWSGVPPEVPVAELVNAYLTGVGIGAIVLTYLMFVDFRYVIQSTKDWSQRYQKKTDVPPS